MFPSSQPVRIMRSVMGTMQWIWSGWPAKRSMWKPKSPHLKIKMVPSPDPTSKRVSLRTSASDVRSLPYISDCKDGKLKYVMIKSDCTQHWVSATFTRLVN